MSAWVYARSGYDSVLAALVADLHWHARLYVNDPALTPDAVRGDFVEPAFFGYAQQPMRRWTPPKMRAGVSWSMCDPLIWKWVSGAAPAPIRGVWVTDGLHGPLVWAWRRPGAAFALGPSHPVLVAYGRLRFPFPLP